MYMCVKDKAYTTKADYQLEHFHYRMIHQCVQEFTVNKSYYYFYRTIAKKYDWPYIKESYDNEDDRPQLINPILPKDPPKPTKVDIYLQSLSFKQYYFSLDVILFGVVVTYILINDTYPGDPWYVTMLASALLGLFMQVIFVPVYFVVKLFMPKTT